MTELITSTANPSVRWLKRLHRAKNRRAEGVALVEGITAVRELIACPERVVRLFWSASCLEKPAGKALIDGLDGAGLPVQEVAEHVLAAMADTTTPQGVLAVATCAPVDLAVLAELAPAGGDVLVLDGVQDPGNVGTLIRSLAAVGGAGVVLTGACADPTGPKVVRAAAGALFSVSYVLWGASTDDLADHSADGLADALTAMGYRIAVARADGGETPQKLAQGGPIAWVLGAEGGGVCDALRARADLSVAIPMAAGVESLNVAVAGSLLLYSRVFSRAGD